jgi:beta-lactamase regulating signal transducer with metallopeptidase domain
MPVYCHLIYILQQNYIHTALSYIALLRRAKALPLCEDDKALSALELIKLKLKIKKKIRLVYGEQPCIFGILKHTLCIPMGFTEDELNVIITHELIHFKYADLWINWLTAVLRAVYWFNPVIWLSFRQMHKDCELACDERVLLLSGIDKQLYAKVLFNKALTGKKYLIGSTAFVNNESDIKKRIRFINKFKKPKLIWIIIAIVFLIAIIMATLTNPLKKSCQQF